MSSRLNLWKKFWWEFLIFFFLIISERTLKLLQMKDKTYLTWVYHFTIFLTKHCNVVPLCRNEIRNGYSASIYFIRAACYCILIACFYETFIRILTLQGGFLLRHWFTKKSLKDWVPVQQGQPYHIERRHLISFTRETFKRFYHLKISLRLRNTKLLSTRGRGIRTLFSFSQKVSSQFSSTVKPVLIKVFI